jgi:hypothetical protein
VIEIAVAVWVSMKPCRKRRWRSTAWQGHANDASFTAAATRIAVHQPGLTL